MNSRDGSSAPLVLLRVVIADQGISTNDGLTALLSEIEGISVLGCTQEPAKVLALVKAAKPDVLILDLQNDRATDLAALRRIKALPRPPVVIVLSHYNLAPLRHAARAAGADHFLIKTTQCAQLQDVLRGLHRATQRSVRSAPPRKSLTRPELLSRRTS